MKVLSLAVGEGRGFHIYYIYCRGGLCKLPVETLFCDGNSQHHKIYYEEQDREGGGKG